MSLLVIRINGITMWHRFISLISLPSYTSIYLVFPRNTIPEFLRPCSNIVVARWGKRSELSVRRYDPRQQRKILSRVVWHWILRKIPFEILMANVKRDLAKDIFVKTYPFYLIRKIVENRPIRSIRPHCEQSFDWLACWLAGWLSGWLVGFLSITTLPWKSNEERNCRP